jgi:mannose-6-phosphate isomerase
MVNFVTGQEKPNRHNEPSPALQRSAARARGWAIEKALPFWAETGTDELGGFCEELDVEKNPNWDAVRRLRVQARQVYTYVLAYNLNWYNGLPVANKTLDFMMNTGFMPDKKFGFVHLLNANLTISDSRRDLYDHAFYLLALAWHGRTTGDHSSFITADAVLDFMDRRLKSDKGGWLEGLPLCDPRNALRRQNPHMHCFEAFLALFDATGSGTYLDRAKEMYELFVAHFMDIKTGTITEYFDTDWTPDAGIKGQSVEPGHAAEWIWLLGQYQIRTGENTRELAAILHEKLLSGQRKYLNDEENKDGLTIRGTKRLWVQTEWVKANLAQSEFGDPESAKRASVTLDHIMRDYLREDGSWIDQLDANGRPIIGAIPTSTFYHILCMIDEACRVAGLREGEITKRRANIRT